MAIAEERNRDLADYLAIIRRRFWLIALVGAVTVGAAGAYTYTQPTVYRSSMKIVVGQGQGIFLPQVGNVAEQFTQTMSDLLTSNVVANRVIRDLDLTLATSDLLDNLHVVTKPSTAVLEVSYDDTDRTQGRDILAAVGQVFTQLVDERLSRGAAVDTSQAVSATIFDPAHVQPDPVQPKPVRTLAVAAVLGLLLGAVAAFVREQFDDTVRDTDSIERAFGQTVTASLPPWLTGYRPLEPRRSRRSEKRRDPARIELALQRLRASIVWSPDSRDARTLLVTSANPEEGKTTVAANLAVSLTAEGYDVILVDADLRRPALHRYLNFGDASPKVPVIGLDALFRGEAEVEQALVDIPVAFSELPSANGSRGSGDGDKAAGGRGRLRAILAAPGQAQASEFDFEGTVSMVKKLRELADYVVIDAPPVLVVTDAYPFAAAVDAVVAVVRSGRSNEGSVAAMSRTLERLRAHQVELIVTDAKPGPHSTYYDYRSPGQRGGAWRRNRAEGNGGADQDDPNRGPSRSRRMPRS